MSEAIADAVGEAFDGQRAAADLIEKVRRSTGDGREIEFSAESATLRTRAFRTGFYRRIQKALER